MKELDPRLGRNQDDVIVYPDKTANGNAYTRPATMLNLGGGYFVILDQFAPTSNDTLDELRSLITPSKKKGKHDDESESASGEQSQPDVTETGEAP